jgi:cellulose synthase operon protein C
VTPRILLCLVAFAAGASAWALPIEYAADRPEALAQCDSQRYRGERAAASRCYGALLGHEDLRVSAEAARALGDLQLANRHFREAMERYPDDPSVRVRWGELFRQTHQNNDAVQLYQEALGMDESYAPAKLGLASVAAGRFEDRARQWADEVLAENPRDIKAHLLVARMDLEEGALERAEERLAEAARIAEADGLPPLEVYTLKAAADLLHGVEDSPWIERALEYNPRYGELYETLGYFYVITRRYRQATELLRRAIELRPDLHSAHAELGVNLLRQNRVAEAQRHLATAYQGDPFSPQIVNTLRLIDSFDNFVVTAHPVDPDAEEERPGIILRLHRDEAEVLEPYVLDLARRSIEAFSQRYDFELAEPMVVELYPQHDDFAVRTSGLPGIGLLGVAFGYLVAMDSPSARADGEFHWGTTLWHEIAHVFTLGATDHLVPRWFSEGVSVYEEWSTGPLPGRHIPLAVFEAMKEDRLLPVVELDQGFIRPTYASQVIVSYTQAGLICEYVAARWGQEALQAILRSFAEGLDTGEALERSLAIPPETFDAEFKAHLDEEFGELIANLDTWRNAQAAAHQAAERASWGAVAESAAEAIALYPEHVGRGSAYPLAAKAHAELGDRDAAIQTLAEYRRLGGYDPEALVQLADWLEQAARDEEAIDVLQDVLWVAPLQRNLHVRLGDGLLEAGRVEEALIEYHASLAMNPHDQATAHYRLARAHLALGDRARTREHLLYALEIAPHYREAQQLLLEIAR